MTYALGSSYPQVVPEPVTKWQNVDGAGKFNMLDAFYKDPQRYAYTFQNYVFLTRMMQVGSLPNMDKICI